MSKRGKPWRTASSCRTSTGVGVSERLIQAGAPPPATHLRETRERFLRQRAVRLDRRHRILEHPINELGPKFGALIPMGTDENAGLIPFSVQIGVTGHRELVVSEQLLKDVRRQLEAVRKLLSAAKTTNVGFNILSALAEGADRIVVEQAYEVLDNVELHAVLPLMEDDYRNDFKADGSVEQFTRLLRLATRRTQIPPTGSRSEAYERAGHFIVEHCDVLVALWDGDAALGRGGTAETVEFANAEGVPVLLVPVRRRNPPDSPSKDPPSSGASPVLRSSAAHTLRRIEEYNGVPPDDPNVDRSLRVEGERLERTVADSPVRAQYALVASWTLPRFARADALAMHYQRLHYRSATVMYGLAAIALSLVAAQSEFGWKAIIALTEVVIMGALLTIYWLGRSRELNNRWLGYRSLAEAFRSALFTTLVGGQERRDGEPSAGPSVNKLSWYQRAFVEAWRSRPSPVASRASGEELRRLLIEGLIDDQVGYHEEAVERYRRGRTWLTVPVFVLFGATMVFGALHAFSAVGGWFWPRMFVVLAIALPGFGAALAGIRDQRQFRAHEHRSLMMIARLDQLRRQLEADTSISNVQKLSLDTQVLLEDENVDWSGVIEFEDLEMVF